MSLKLRVISDHYKALGPRRSQLFGVTGGTIGRSADNDWVLPDTKHFVSGRHAKISFRAGTWLLEDTSRNGVYLNDADSPLSEAGPAKLADGDRLRIGEYDVLVSINEHNDFSPDASGQMPMAPALRDRASPQSKRSRKSAGKHGSFRSEPPSPNAALDSFLQPDLDVTDILPSKRGKHDALASSASIQLHIDAAPSVSDALSDFCHGLGIEPSSLPSRTQSALLTAAGQLLRETVTQLSRAFGRQSARAAELEMDAALLSGQQDNPLQTAPSYQATIYRLLDAHSDRKLNGVDALRDAFERIRDHQEAFDASIAPAIDELLARLDPARLSARFDRPNTGVSVFPGGKKAKYWEQFGEVFTAVDQRDARGWPTIFAREFVKAMTTKLRERRTPDRE